MMSEFVFYASLGMNSILVMLTFWGMLAFYPNHGLRGNTAASWLILAIWLGFASLCLRTAYWRVFGDIAIYAGYLTEEDVTRFGKNVVDFFWNIIAVTSVYLHFFARYKSISAEEQKHWTPLMMGFYPDLSHWAVRASSKFQWLRGQKHTKD